MRVTGLETTIVKVPFDKPLKTAIHHIEGVGCALLTVRTDEGISGEAYAFTMNGARIKVIDAMIHELEEMIVGRDPFDTEAIWQSIWDSYNFLGHKGISIIALSTVDTALWDIVGKAAGKPLHKLWGAARESIPTYASGGQWLSYSIDELQSEAAGFVTEGHRALKIRIGKPTVAEDVERVAAVRQAVGPEIGLMVDANQGMTPKHAIKLARELEALDLIWFEEPTPCWDFKGHAEVRSATEIPIASGETEYTRYGMQQMIETGACDILMPDLQRIGGYTEFKRAAQLAASVDMPVTTHIFTEHSLPIAGHAPNCTWLEHMPWFAPLFNEGVIVEEGKVALPDRPGHGFTFSEEAVARFRVS